MHYREIASNLERTGKQLLELSEAITDKGRPLTIGEIKMVKIAMYGTVEGLLEEAGYFYLTGNPQDIASNMERIQEIAVAVNSLD